MQLQLELLYEVQIKLKENENIFRDNTSVYSSHLPNLPAGFMNS